jgi:WD40 repeat protein
VSKKRSKQRTNPFVGPRPFLPGEPLFGRDPETSELRNLLVAERIVALYSPSGAGKTSLVQAGLIPKMQESDFHVLPVIRVNQPPIAGNGDGTNRYVESALRSLDENLSEAEQQTSDDINHLRLGDYLVKRPRPTGAPATDLLIFDQFEEILTLDPTDGDAKTEFFTQVGEALRGEERWALFSFREDHLAGLDPFLPLIPTRLATTFRLGFLSREAAVLAIQGTAGKGGVAFTEEAAEQLVTDLSRVRVQQPDRSVEERPGPDIQPVQLQVVCHRLWNQLSDDQIQIDLELVKAHGDVSDALGGFYADSVAAVAQKSGAPERDIRAWFDEHLITKQGIRGQMLWESVQGTGLNDEAIRELIDTHLVRAEARRGATWLELAHDRLIDPVRSNNDNWYQANLNALQQQARLWQSQDRAPGYLLSGEALTQAEQWAADNQGSLTGIDREFLDDSRNQRKLQDADRRDLEAAQRLAQEAQARQQAEEAVRHEAEQRVVEQGLAATALQRRLRWAVVAGAVAILAAVGSFFLFKEADVQRNKAEALATTVAVQQQQAVEQTQRFAIERLGDAVAEEVATRHDELGALLARQAFLLDEDAGRLVPAVTNQALHDALGVPYFSRILPDQEGPVSVVTFSPNGRFIVSGGAQGTIRFWSLGDPAPVAPTLLPGPQPAVAVRSLAFSPDGQTLATGSGDGNVRLWHLNGTAEPETLPGPEPVLPVRSVAFSPDGKTLASGSGDGIVRLWDLAHLAAEPVRLRGHRGPVITIAFSPVEPTLASGGGDGTIRLWDLANLAAEPVLLTGHLDAVQSLTFSPDGKTLTSGSRDSTVRMWDLTDADPTQPVVVEHEDSVQSVAFSPDGKTLASGSGDDTVRLWDLMDAEPAELVVLAGHADVVQSVAFSPDGRFLASGSEDGSVRLWDRDASGAASTILNGLDGSVNSERLSELVCEMVGRNLTLEEWNQFIGPDKPYQPTCPNLPPDERASAEAGASRATPRAG